MTSTGTARWREIFLDIAVVSRRLLRQTWCRLARVQLSAKTVLLTGATGGLGRAIAFALASRGASVVLSSRKAAELESLAAELPGSGHRVAVTDLAEEGEALTLLEQAGEIDVLVVRAAWLRPSRLRLVDLGEGRDRARLALCGDQVRASRLRSLPARGPARQRRRRLGDQPRGDSRRGYVR